MSQDYTIKKLNARVANTGPAMLTTFRFRAIHRCKKLNAKLRAETYRWEVCDWLDGRWAVVAMQNVAVPRRAKQT